MSQNPFRIRVILFLSTSFGIETGKYVHTLRPTSYLENRTRFQTQMGKVYTCFQTKRAQNSFLWGGTYIYGLYKGVPSPPPPLPQALFSLQITEE